VTWNVGTTGVDDQGQVYGWEELFDELAAELTLHKGVGRDLPGEAARSGELVDTLRERNGERVFS
jgi:hypothetical protein